MTAADVVILAAAVLCVAGTVVFAVRRRRSGKGGCGGCTGCCPGCTREQGQEKTNKDNEKGK